MKEMEVYGSMLMMRTSRPHFIQGVLGGRSGRGPLTGLMAPRVSWRWGRGWNLCGEISQFSIASGNWQLVRSLTHDETAPVACFTPWQQPKSLGVDPPSWLLLR